MSQKLERVVTRQRVDPIKLRLAKDMRSTPTREENLLWQRLRRGQLNGLHFRRQQVIDGFIVDFFCHQAALAVEVDGPIHLASQDYDRERDQVLALRGVSVLRLASSEVAENMKSTLTQIADAAQSRIQELESDRSSPSL